MKKIVICVIAGMLLGATVHATVIQTITKAAATAIRIDVEWDTPLNEIEWVTFDVNGIAVDALGARVQTRQRVRFQYDDLAANTQASVRNLIQFAGKEYSEKVAAESVTPNFKANMQRPR